MATVDKQPIMDTSLLDLNSNNSVDINGQSATHNNDASNPAFEGTWFINSDEESRNFARVVCALLEQGTASMQHVMESHLPHRCVTLQEAITKYESDLRKLKGTVLNAQQMNTLGLNPPTSSVVNTASIDMSLWFILIRNISTLNSIRFNRLLQQPLKPTQKDTCHDIVRLNKYRNYIVHLPQPKLTNQEFDEIWPKLSDALMRLGVDQQTLDERYMLSEGLDPKQTLLHFISLQRQAQRELQGSYDHEVRRKQTITRCAVLVVAAILAAALVTIWCIFTFSRTWSSCINSMEYINSSNTAAISFMPRDGWGAAKPHHSNPYLAPKLDYVIISATQATGRCQTTDDCCSTMRRVQELAFKIPNDDIMFNFLIGQDAVVYEGRNRTMSAGARGWNSKSVTIGFLGTFLSSPPNDDSVSTAQNFLQYLVDIGMLSRNFTLYGLCQVRNFPYAPGCEFYKRMRTWKATAPHSTWQWRDRPGGHCCV